MNDMTNGPLNGPMNDEEMLRLVQSGLPPDQLRAEVTRRLVRQAEAEEPEWGALLRAAAIPRRLDEGVVGVLRSAPDDADGNRTALERLAGYSFVLPDPEGRSYALHEEARAVLLEDWQAPERRACYVELSQALHDHALAEEQEWEALYHRFVFDPAGAFGEFKRRFYEADKFYRRTECGALLATAQEQELGEGQRLWLRYYRARLALVLGHWAEAEAGYRKLLAEWPPSSPAHCPPEEEEKLRTWALHTLGVALDSQGKWTEAVEVHQEALKGYRELGDRYNESRSFINLGSVYQAQGRWDKAIECYQESLRICRELGDRRGEGPTLNNLGETYTVQGRWQEAKACFDQSLPIRRGLGDRPGEAYVLHNLGRWHEGQGQLDEAIARYQEALRIRRELEAWPEAGETLHALAEVYVLRGDLPKAAEMAQRAAAAWRRATKTGVATDIETEDGNTFETNEM